MIRQISFALLTLFLGTTACSSSSSSGGGGSSNSCVGAYAGSADCFSCVQSSCSSQLNTFTSACSDFLSCSCPNGTLDANAESSQACQSKRTSSCQSADNALFEMGGCVLQSCAHPCGAS